MTTTEWTDRELDTARQLVGQASQALRQNNVAAARAGLTEADAILDMSGGQAVEALQLRAQIQNELGVSFQRQNDLEQAEKLHRRAIETCEQLIERDVDFRGNAAATYLNLASVVAAKNDLVSARKANERALELIDELREAGEDGVDSLAMGAHQNQALIFGRNARWDDASAQLDRLLEVAEKMAARGEKHALPQAAQACQRLSVQLFEAGEHERALDWGRKAEELSEEAFNTLGQDVLPIYVVSQINLISYFERMGRFADAEDALWKALEVSGNDPEIVRRGKAFYENCRKHADNKLEAGDLPREEVEEGLAELDEIIEEMGGLPEPQPQG